MPTAVETAAITTPAKAGLDAMINGAKTRAATPVTPRPARTEWLKEFPVVAEEEIREFAKAIKDFNPLHHDEGFALQNGFLGIIAPGVMVIGYASAAIAEELPGVLIRRLDLKFKHPMYAGAMPTVLCNTTHVRGPIAEMDISIRNGAEVLAEGHGILFQTQV